jgi:Short C-terminal domain
VFTYLIVQGRRMAERNIDRAAQRQRGLDQYIRTVSASSHTSGLEEIAKAQELLDSGAITREEFEVMKRRVLSSA